MSKHKFNAEELERITKFRQARDLYNMNPGKYSFRIYLKFPAGFIGESISEEHGHYIQMREPGKGILYSQKIIKLNGELE